MSVFLRSARAAPRLAPKTRSYSLVVDAPPSEWAAKREAIKDHAKGTTDLWRRISFFICVPATITLIAWVRNVEEEHAEHTKHEIEANGGERPEPPAYDYLNKRAKPFPWGPNSLFWNPHVNKDMSEE